MRWKNDVRWCLFQDTTLNFPENAEIVKHANVSASAKVQSYAFHAIISINHLILLQPK
jgi:hypothetical protein